MVLTADDTRDDGDRAEPVPDGVPGETHHAEPPTGFPRATPPSWPPPDWTPEDLAEWQDEREAIAWEGQPTHIGEIMPVVLAAHGLEQVAA